MNHGGRVIGRLFGAIGELVEDGRNSVFLRLSVPDGRDLVVWRQRLANAIDDVNHDISSGFDLPDERAVGHEVSLPLDEEKLAAIEYTLRMLSGVETKATELKPDALKPEARLQIPAQ